jgi:aerobic C4-dicarboxylate transport protein
MAKSEITSRTANIRTLPGKLWFQVLLAFIFAIALGIIAPDVAVAMKPLGDGFVKLIKMIVPFVVLFTVICGICSSGGMKKAGRIGVTSLIYFEVVSTLALLIGFCAAARFRPGDGFNAVLTTADSAALQSYTSESPKQSIAEFLLNIIPNTVVSGMADGAILPVVLLAVLFGHAISAAGPRGEPMLLLARSGSDVTMIVVNVIMRLAPIGTFGAMAFTVGRYGVASFAPLLKLIGLFWLVSSAFVIIVLGVILLYAHANIFRLLIYLKAEILLILGTSSSEAALPTLMEKLELAGCSKSVVGLVVPTGYIFNTDGSAIYMTFAAMFIAQATNTPLTHAQEFTLLGVAMLTSKGASGVTGASFVALVGALSVVPSIPLAGMALILGIDRVMSVARALVNMISNAVATLVIAQANGELDRSVLDAALRGGVPMTGD